MATDKQIEANRRNARLSPGPRSLAGKAKSRQNALSHGLTASQTMLPGEDPAEFAGMRESMFNSLRPLNDVEFQLVERIASLVWRLRRVQAFEVALMKWMAHCQAATYDAPLDIADLSAVERRNDPNDDIDDLEDSLRVGRAFEALLSHDLTTKMTLYESRMQRQLSLVLKDLSDLKLARAKRAQLARTEPKPQFPTEPPYDEYLPYKGMWVKKTRTPLRKIETAILGYCDLMGLTLIAPLPIPMGHALRPLSRPSVLSFVGVRPPTTAPLSTKRRISQQIH